MEIELAAAELLMLVVPHLVATAHVLHLFAHLSQVRTGFFRHRQ